MKYLLDTNICIYAQKGVPSVLRNIQAHWQEGIAISAITLAELEHGVAASANPQKNAVALLKMLSILDVLPFDSDAASEYGVINAALRKQGTPIGTMDTLIAAHGKAAGLIVVTHNTREFQRVDGLQLVDWYEES